MSAAAWWVIALVVVAVLALLGLAWAGARERRADAAYWAVTHEPPRPAPLDRANEALAEQVHAIDLDEHTVEPWPQPLSPSDLDCVRNLPLTIPAGWVRPKPAHHAAVDDTGTWGMAELGEGVAAVDPEPTLGRHSYDAARLRQITGTVTQAPRWAGDPTGAWQLVGAA